MVGNADDNLAILTLFERWYRAMEDGSVAELLSLVTDDVIVMAPGSPPILGIRSLEQALTGFLKEYSEKVGYEVAEVEVSGQLAFARILECTRIQSRSGSEASTVHGVHLSILKRQPGGEWLIARDVSSLINQSENGTIT